MVDVVSDQTEISYAESVANWSGDTFSLDTEILVQGGNSVSCIQTANGINDVIYTGGPWNMAGKHIRLYMLSNITANMAVTNAIQIILDDGTNQATFTVFNSGSDYGGGWKDIFFDVDSTPLSGTVDTSAITSVTLRINTSTKPRNAINGWYDNWRFGNGLEINSDAAEAISFTDVATNDALVANKYDILENVDDVLFGKGKLTLGNAGGAKNCNLQSTNEQIVFIDRVVSATLYGLVASEGTGITTIALTGLVCKTVGLSGAEIDFSTQVSNLGIAGSTFIGMGTMSFVLASISTLIQANGFTLCGATSIGSGMDFIGCSWTNCLAITAIGSITGGIVDGSTASAAVVTASLNLITGVAFSDSAGHAVELTSIGAGSMSWDNTLDGYDAGVAASPVTPTSTGNEAIFVNVASGTLTINVTDGASIPSIRSAGAIVNVVAGLKTFDFTLSPSITGYEWRIYTVTAVGSLVGAVEIAGEEVATLDNQSISHNYASQPIAVQILSGPYEEEIRYETLTAVDKSIVIDLTVDNND